MKTLLVAFAVLIGAATPVSAGVRPSQPKLVIAMGDSITQGFALADDILAWPARATLLSRGQFDVINDGISGNMLATVDYASPAYGAPMQTRVVTALKFHPFAVVLLGGTNDIGAGQVAPRIEKAIANIAQLCHEAGAKFIVSTIPPELSSLVQGPVPLDSTAVRDAVNRWIVEHFPHVISFYQHLAINGVLPVSEQARGDGVHPSAAADLWFARQVDLMLAVLSR